MKKYNRILIKFSGEALADESGFGLSSSNIALLTDQIEELWKEGIQIGVVLADDFSDMLVAAELPITELALVKHLLGRTVAHFHIVNARLDICLVKCLYEIVGKEEIVAKTAISEGSVNDLDAFSEAH